MKPLPIPGIREEDPNLSTIHEEDHHVLTREAEAALSDGLAALQQLHHNKVNDPHDSAFPGLGWSSFPCSDSPSSSPRSHSRRNSVSEVGTPQDSSRPTTRGSSVSDKKSLEGAPPVRRGSFPRSAARSGGVFSEDLCKQLARTTRATSLPSGPLARPTGALHLLSGLSTENLTETGTFWVEYEFTLPPVVNTRSVEVSMNLNLSEAAAPEADVGPKREKQIEDAREMYETVLRNAKRSNTAVPPYEFLELIGKGGSGRVYKCKKESTGELVAVKIVNIDDDDYQTHALERDEAIKNFRKEVGILQQLKDSNARNVNMIHEAFDLHNQLWIISDYCTGGSVRTLMRANPPTNKGLEQRFIIPIARELAVAIKSVHDIGVIHRDIKCTNVYINEEGDIQLGDYGIVGEVEPGSSKRKTIIGTPHYMAREVLNSETMEAAEGYGTEVDIWAYGCTVYEMATGSPPNSNMHPDELHRVNATAPRLDPNDHSQGLRDFVAFCLNIDPSERPSAEAVLSHPYIAHTNEQYATSSLVQLIERYMVWEYKGGQRQSLWWTGGAAPPSVNNVKDESKDDEENDWNFNTSDNFTQEFEKRYTAGNVAERDFALEGFEAPPGAGLPPLITTNLSRFEQIEAHHKEMSATRGGKSLGRVFDPESEPYELHTPLTGDSTPSSTSSDLIFRRTASGGTNIRESLIDLDTAGVSDFPGTNFDFGNVPTLRPKGPRPMTEEEEEEDNYTYAGQDGADKRATMEWTFPAANTMPTAKLMPTAENSMSEKRATMEWTFQTAEPAEHDDSNMSMELPGADADSLPPGFRPALKHRATEPLDDFRDHLHPAQPIMPSSSSPMRYSISSMIDLDMALTDPHPSEIVRPGTASSVLSSSAHSDLTSGNPFDLEDDPEQIEIDRSRFSYHKQWQSEGGQLKRYSHKNMQMHSRGSSLTSSTDLEIFDPSADRMRSAAGHPHMYPGAGEPSMDTNQWPNFGPDSSLDDDDSHSSHERITRSNTLPPPSDSRARDYSHARNGGQPEIDFPKPEAPHPDALLEDADPSAVTSELHRLLRDLETGCDATVHALRWNTGIDEDGGHRGTFNGDRSDTSTDEDGF